MHRRTANQVQACAEIQPMRFTHAQIDKQSDSGMRRQTANQVQACLYRQPTRVRHAQADSQSGSGMHRQTTNQVQPFIYSISNYSNLVHVRADKWHRVRQDQTDS